MKLVVTPLAQLTTSREPPNKDDEELLKLVASIQENGCFVPPLVNDSFGIIDGVKRVAALKSLGYEEGIVAIPDTLEEAFANLDEAHLQFPGYARAWEIRQDLEYLMERRRAGSRGNRWTGPRSDKQVSSGQLLRTVFVDALKARSFSALDDALRLYRMRDWHATDPQIHARVTQLIERMERGEVSPLIAHKLLSSPKSGIDVRGGVRGGAEQEAFLESAARNLHALMRSMTRIGFPVTVPAAKLNTIISDLRQSRAELTRMIWTLTEEAKKNGS